MHKSVTAVTTPNPNFDKHDPPEQSAQPVQPIPPPLVQPPPPVMPPYTQPPIAYHQPQPQAIVAQQTAQPWPVAYPLPQPQPTQMPLYAHMQPIQPIYYQTQQPIAVPMMTQLPAQQSQPILPQVSATAVAAASAPASTVTAAVPPVSPTPMAHSSLSSSFSSGVVGGGSLSASHSALVDSLQRDLKETRETLAREQAHVRSVKAYYQQHQQQHQQQQNHADDTKNHTVTSMAGPAVSSSSSSLLRSSSSLPFLHAHSSTPAFSSPLIGPPASSGAVAPPSSSSLLDNYRSEISHLKQQVDLLKIQNAATAEVMRMKDQQMEQLVKANMQQTKSNGRVANETAKASSPYASFSSSPSAVLDLSHLWREKVFALLVQNKSLILTHANERRAYLKDIAERDEKIRQVSQEAILERKQKEASEAQLRVFQNEASHRAQQQSQTHTLQTHLLHAKAALDQDVQSVYQLLHSFESHHSASERRLGRIVLDKLAGLNQRVEFAKQRVGVIRRIKNRHTQKGRNDNDDANEDETTRRIIPTMTKKEESKEGIDENDTTRHLKIEIERLQTESDKRQKQKKRWKEKSVTLLRVSHLACVCCPCICVLSVVLTSTLPGSAKYLPCAVNSAPPIRTWPPLVPKSPLSRAHSLPRMVSWRARSSHRTSGMPNRIIAFRNLNWSISSMTPHTASRPSRPSCTISPNNTPPYSRVIPS